MCILVMLIEHVLVYWYIACRSIQSKKSTSYFPLNTSSTFDSSVVPHIIHGSSTPLYILLCITKYSSICFSSPLPSFCLLASPFLRTRLCIDRILTTACLTAVDPKGSIAARSDTTRAACVYRCRVHRCCSLGERAAMRALREEKRPSAQIWDRVVRSFLC